MQRKVRGRPVGIGPFGAPAANTESPRRPLQRRPRANHQTRWRASWPPRPLRSGLFVPPFNKKDEPFQLERCIVEHDVVRVVEVEAGAVHVRRADQRHLAVDRRSPKDMSFSLLCCDDCGRRRGAEVSAEFPPMLAATPTYPNSGKPLKCSAKIPESPLSLGAHRVEIWGARRLDRAAATSMKWPVMVI